jgi:hypothetical protein
VTNTNPTVKQSGHALLTVKPKSGGEEKYLITLRTSPHHKPLAVRLYPAKLRIEGIVWGSPYVELTENSAIQSSTGFTAAIEYKGKGYFSGKPHTFKAVLTQGSKQIQTYEGQWTGVSHIGGSKGPVFLDTSAPKEEVTVKPISEQGEWESRRLWEKVAKGIRSGQYDEASKDKTRIEVGQYTRGGFR